MGLCGRTRSQHEQGDLKKAHRCDARFIAETASVPDGHADARRTDDDGGSRILHVGDHGQLSACVQYWYGREAVGSPAARWGQATPMTYEANGKQYVVIAAGGHGSFLTKLGDYVIAYTLPDRR
jgi:hypothetical protein